MFTPTNITNPDQINDELLEMQEFLESPYAQDNEADVLSRFDKLGAYMARSGKLEADANYHFNKTVESAVFDTIKKMLTEKLSPSTINTFVKAAAKDYKFLVDWADRVNASCTHQYEGLRTVISKLKSEREAARWQR